MERRQFGILAMPNGGTITARNNRAGFNGTGNSQSSLYFGGQVGPDIFYQVQGNTLLGDARDAPGRAGVHARHRHAGRPRDGRDGGRRRQRRRPSLQLRGNPMEFVPCDNKTAHVAYIAIAEKTDQPGRDAQRRQGTTPTSASPTTTLKPGESGNPVKTLRLRYDAWVTLRRPATCRPAADAVQAGGDEVGHGLGLCLGLGLGARAWGLRLGPASGVQITRSSDRSPDLQISRSPAPDHQLSTSPDHEILALAVIPPPLLRLQE